MDETGDDVGRLPTPRHAELSPFRRAVVEVGVDHALIGQPRPDGDRLEMLYGLPAQAYGDRSFRDRFPREGVGCRNKF